MEELQRDIGRIEGKLDLLLERASRSETHREELSTRLTNIETELSKAKGMAAGIATVVSAASAYVGHLLGKGA